MNPVTTDNRHRHDPRKRGVRLTTVLLVAVALAIYIGFILAGVLRA